MQTNAPKMILKEAKGYSTIFFNINLEPIIGNDDKKDKNGWKFGF